MPGVDYIDYALYFPFKLNWESKSNNNTIIIAVVLTFCTSIITTTVMGDTNVVGDTMVDLDTTIVVDTTVDTIIANTLATTLTYHKTILYL